MINPGQGLLGLVLLVGLTGCFNDTPYSSSYSHIIMRVVGPGEVTMTKKEGTVTCTEEKNVCGTGNLISEGVVLKYEATPFEGRTFMGWTGDTNSKDNPLSVPSDGDYYFYANFE